MSRTNAMRSGFKKSTSTGQVTSGKKSKWLEVGTIFERKDGSGFFLSVKSDVDLTEGQILNLQTPEEKINRLVAAGHLTEEEGQERLEKVPATVKFEVVLPPND